MITGSHANPVTVFESFSMVTIGLEECSFNRQTNQGVNLICFAYCTEVNFSYAKSILNRKIVSLG
jgi:hypothetical protein